MKKTDFEKHHGAFSIALLILFSAIFFLPAILHEKTFYGFDTLFDYLPWASYDRDFRPHNPLLTDPVNFFYPIYHTYQSSLGNLELPLWNHHNFLGSSFTFFNIYPLIFYALLPITTAHDFLLFFHLAGTGIFTFLYLREIGLKSMPSVLGSVSWMFNGYIMVWFEFEYTLIMAMTLSATLYFIERLFRTRTAVSILSLSVILVISVCTGYAHLLIYQSLMIGFYILYRCHLKITGNGHIGKSIIPPLKCLAIAIAISVVVSVNVFTSFAAIYQGSQRKELTPRQLFMKKGQLPAKYLTTLLFPKFYGTPVLDYKTNRYVSFTPKTHESQTYNNYNELCIYSGILSLFLALACIPFIGRIPYIGFFVISGLLTILLPMTFLYYPLALFVPGLNLSTPTRILYLFGFSVSVLAAFGANIIQEQKKISNSWIAVLWISIPIAAICIAMFVQTEAGMKWATGLPLLSDTDRNLLHPHFALSSDVIGHPLLTIFATCIILFGFLYASRKRYRNFFLCIGIVLLLNDLVSFGHFYNTVSPREFEFPETPAIRFLKNDKSLYRIVTTEGFMHNSFVPFGIEDIGGYSSFYPKRYGEFFKISQQGPNTKLPDEFSRWLNFKKLDSPLLDLINTKYFLTSPRMKMDSNKLELVYRGEINIYENPDALPRIFFVPNYHLAGSPQDACKILGESSRKDFLDRVILETPPPDFIQKNRDFSPKGGEAIINVVSYKPSKIEIGLVSNSNGFLVISNNYHSGWKAKNGNRPVKILRTNYIMQAIPVKKGENKVTLAFRPNLLIAGLITTIVGSIALLTVLAICLIKQSSNAKRLAAKCSGS